MNGSGVVLESASNATLLNDDVTDNGDTGIEFVEANGPGTVANNVVSDNGGLELYGTFAHPNGEKGVYLESSSNVTVRNNTTEGNEQYGVRIGDDSHDNRIAENDITAHTSANETGRGVFILGRGVGFPANNTVADNTITDNDHDVSVFHDIDTVLRGNDILRNGIGVRLGSNTEPISSSETVECTDGGVLAFDNRFGGSTEGTVVGSRTRTDGTALRIVTHPSQTTTCDGTTPMSPTTTPRSRAT